MGVHKIDPKQMIEVKRKKNRERQADYRERIRLASTEVTADEMFDVFPDRFPAQYAAIKEYEKEFKAAVASELGVKISDDDFEYTLDRVAQILYSFQHDLIFRVTNPKGDLFGGMYYADVFGEDLVKETRRFDLERSATYAAAYRELLDLLDQRYGKNSQSGDAVEAASAKAVREELLGRING